jgi:hypothetical protein
VLSLEISLPVAAASGTGVDHPALICRSGIESHALLAKRRCRSDGHRRIRQRTIGVPGGKPWTALGRANQSLTFSWKRKADDRRAEMPLRFVRGSPRRSVSAKKSRTISSVVRVEVQQGLAREVSLAIPAGLGREPGQRRDGGRLDGEGGC